MILVRAPLRISFFGGGSDLPAFYTKETGYVLSTTIDKSIYLGINRSNHDYIKVVYSEIEIEKDVTKIKHSIVRETLSHFDIRNNIEISTFADIPVKGTGLGSSSSYCAALVRACADLKHKSLSDKEVAELACKIEIERCKEPIGKQDQYAAAFGGMNLIRFNTDNTVDVTKCQLSDDVARNLEAHMLLFYTGIVRNARDVLQEQNKNLALPDKHTITSYLAEQAQIAYKALPAGDIKLIGNMLHDAWAMKKSLAASISNSTIDQMYEAALEKGAWGGKVLGAGGGGYLMVVAEPKYHSDIKKALDKFACFNIKFYNKGAEIVYNTEG